MMVRVAVHRSWFVAFGIGVLFVALAFFHPLRAHAATITVTNTNDITIVGDGVSLREAILSINAGANINADVVAVGAYGTSDTIKFNISPNGVGVVQTITVTSVLPTLTKPMTINGYSQPFAIANSNPLASGDNAVILIALSPTGAFDGLVVTTTQAGTVIEGLALGNFQTAVNLVGANGVTVAGNFIGTNATGDTARPGINGVVLQNGATNITVGGTTAAARNLISGNTTNGILIQNSGTTGNVVEDNYIGTNAAGTTALPNTFAGVNILLGATNNTVGGAATGAGNVIAGNTNGVAIQDSGTTNNVVEDNYIGTDATGTFALPNSIGVIILGGASGTTVGGTAAGARNVIAGNTYGVFIQNSGTTGTTVEGNYIGTNAAGTAAPANTFGVNILAGASGNTIGGTTAGARNLISGNGTGVFLWDSGTTNNVVAGNYIGTNATGNAALPNLNGVIILGGASGNTVGGTAAGAGNTIAFSPLFGVSIGNDPTDNVTVNNAVLGNSIHDNGGTHSGATGLDLGRDDITPNGANPRSFPNDGQNYPVLTAAYGSTVTGTLDTFTNATFRVEFFASPSGATGGRNGQAFLGFVTAPTGGGGHAALTFTAASALPAGSVITATATNVTAGPQMNDTSEFSAPLTITAAPLTSIALTGPGGATALTLKVGQSAALTATGTYADHSMQTIPPGSVQWQSSNSAVVMVDASGNLTVESAGGPVTITGTFNGVTGQIVVTVTAPTPIGITVPPAPQNRPSGTTIESNPAPAPAPRSGGSPLPAVGPQSGSAPSSSPAPAPVPPSR